MIEFITQNFVPLMFGGLLAFLLTGIPVAFGLAATGLVFGFLGMEVGLFGSTMFQALPLRMKRRWSACAWHCITFPSRIVC